MLAMLGDFQDLSNDDLYSLSIFFGLANIITNKKQNESKHNT